MKKLFVMMLATMLASGFLCATAKADAGVDAEQATFHLLWDIPFDISPWECLRLLEERTGARLQIDESLGWPQVVTEPDSRVTLFEREASVWTLVHGSDNKLDSIVLTFKEASLPTDVSAEQRAAQADIGLACFETLRQKLTEAYGMPSVACVEFPASKEETERIVAHRLPLRGAAIDYEELIQTTAEAQAEFSVVICWNNVWMRYYSHPGHLSGHLLTTEIFFSREAHQYAPETFEDYARPNYK